MEAGSSSIGSGERIAYRTLNRLLTDGTFFLRNINLVV